MKIEASLNIGTFEKLKPCATYFLKNHLYELSKFQVSLLKESPNHFFQFNNTLPEDSLINLASESFTYIFAIITRSSESEVKFSFLNILKDYITSYKSPEEDYIPQFLKYFKYQNKTINRYLPHFSQDIHEVLDLVNDLDDFFLQHEVIIQQYASVTHHIDENTASAYLKTLINSTMNGVFLFNSKGEITDWNSSMTFFNNIIKTGFKGKHLTDILPDLADSKIIPSLDLVLKGEHLSFSEIRTGGENNVLEITLLPVFNEGKEVIGGICYANNVSDRIASTRILKKQEEKLQFTNSQLEERLEEISTIQKANKTNEQLYRLLAENSSDLISIHNEEGIFTHASPSSEQLIGYKPEELLGKSISQFLHPEDLPKIKDVFQKIWKKTSIKEVSFRLQNKDGHYQWLESTGKVIRDPEDNQILEVQVSSRDITRRIEAELLLEKEKQHLLAVLENVNEAIVACDKSGKITFFNKTARDFHGLTEKAITAEKWASYYNLYSSDGKHLLQKEEVPLFKALKGEKVKDIEIVVISKNGKRRTLLCNGQQIISSDNLWGAVVIMRDITERKHWEETLVKNESLLAESQALAHLGSWEWDMETDSLYWSEELKKIFSFDPNNGTVKNKPYIDFTHPDDKNLVVKEIEKAIQKGEPFTIEHKIILADGSFKWILAKGKVILNEDDKAIRMSGIVLDISEQKLAEIKAKEDQFFIQTIADASPDIIYVYDLQLSKTLYSSRGLGATLGYGNELEWHWGKLHKEELIHQDDKETLEYFHKNLLKLDNQQLLEVKFRIIDKHNSWKWFFIRSTVFKRDRQGHPLQLIGVAQDITEKVKAENAVKHREAQLLEAQRIAHVGSFEWDIRKDVFHWTPEMFRIFGWQSNVNIIKFESISNVIHPDDKERLSEIIEYSKNKNQSLDLEYRIILADNTVKNLSTKGRFYYNKNGEPVKLIGSTIDITQRKKAEEELQKKNEAILQAYQKLEAAQKDMHKINSKLEEMVRERTKELSKTNKKLNDKNKELLVINSDLDNFIYTASHDLKSPISNLEGLTALLNSLLEGRLEEQEQEIMKMVTKSINKFKQTIQDLTEITKVQKEISEKVEMVSFDKVLEDIHIDIRNMIVESNSKIITKFTVKEVPYAVKNLRSIIYNLVTNAIKYRSSERPMVVELETEKNEDYIILTIKDNGLGFHSDQKQKIFQMFKRFHTHVEGTGIGLYIVKRIIENNGGKIEVESELGKGSIFKVFFNIKEFIIYEKI